MIPTTKTAGIGISLKSVLHSPDDGVDSLRRGLDGGLEVESGEGDVFHREVGLQGIRDVLVA